jgi:pimeloyl-ACP methyl ester carboxylesterase
LSAAPPDLEGVEHRFVAANGVRLHVAEAGVADAPPLLLVHGAPQHWWCWRKVIPRLAGSHRVLALDLRGFGWSEAPGHGYDSDTYARDAVALLDALGIERVGVLGHDWGGHMAWILGADHSHRVDRLMVLGAPHLWVRRSPRALAGAWRAWYTLGFASGAWRLDRDRYVEWMLRAGGRAALFDDGEVETYAERLRDPARAEALTRLYRYYHRSASHLLRGRYAHRRLAMPARLLYGDEEPLLWEATFAGPVPCPDYAAEVVPGAGHFLPEERPDLIATRALEFFDSQSFPVPRTPL